MPFLAAIVYSISSEACLVNVVEASKAIPERDQAQQEPNFAQICHPSRLESCCWQKIPQQNLQDNAHGIGIDARSISSGRVRVVEAR